MGQVYGGETDGATRPSVALEIQQCDGAGTYHTSRECRLSIPWMGFGGGRGKGKGGKRLLIYHYE